MGVNILRTYPALYRVVNESLILPTEYNIDTHKILGIDLVLPIESNQDILDTSVTSYIEEDYVYMYRRMLEMDKLIVIICLVGKYIVEVYDDRMSLTMLSDSKYYYVDDCDKFKKETGLIPVGFEKTYLKTDKAFVTPARIYYRPEDSKILVHTKWIYINFIPERHKGKNLYKELCNTEYDYVIKNIDGNSMYFKY
jgi:hypothetical protein